MAYTKNTWVTGDIVTSAKLNHMEDGIAGGTLVLGGFTYDGDTAITGTSDKTWQEIHDALVAGDECVAITHDGDTVRRAVIGMAAHDNVSGIYFIQGEFIAECNSPDGYPTASSNVG